MSSAIVRIALAIGRRAGSPAPLSPATSPFDQWLQKELAAKRAEKQAELARCSAYRLLGTHPRLM